MEAPTKISPFHSPQTFQDPHFKRKKTTSSQTFLSNFFGNFFVEKNKKQPRKTSISQRDSAILLGITFFLCGSITHSCSKLLSERESFRSSLTPSFRDPQSSPRKFRKNAPLPTLSHFLKLTFSEECFGSFCVFNVSPYLTPSLAISFGDGSAGQ